MTFEECLALVEPGVRPSLLTGNGLSRALRDDVFNYANLLERADFQGRDNPLRQLFERLATYDFEAVMRLLQSTKIVLESYGGNDALLEQVRQDQELLKEALIVAITRTHPGRPHDVDPAQFTAARRFFAGFAKVFTVNYDLLFYWARNQRDLPPQDYDTDDGFRAYHRWHEYDTEQDVYFLHGALHIYDDQFAIRKLVHASSDVPIIDQVQRNLEGGKFPLFVAEPTYLKKRKRIERNPYLNYCYRALRGIEGTLFILGHSMDENDAHIFKQVRESRAAKIFISLYGDEDSEANLTTKANARRFLDKNGRTVDFFDAESVSVWG